MEHDPQAALAQAAQRMLRRAPLTCTGLSAEGAAWWVAELRQRLQGPLWIMAPSFSRARDLAHDLSFFAPQAEVGFFPHWDTAPYDQFSPQASTVARRLETLHALEQGTLDVGITTPQAWMQGMLPLPLLRATRCHLRVGALYPRVSLLERLEQAGYRREERVQERGEYAVRGAIVDVFPIQVASPVRLDFMGDELETLRLFDPQTQRSLHASERTEQWVLPAGECPLTAEACARALERLRDALPTMRPEYRRALSARLESGQGFPGYEQALSWFHGRAGWLHEALPAQVSWLLWEPERLEESARVFAKEVETESVRALQQDGFAPHPEEFYLPLSRWRATMQRFYRVECHSQALEGLAEAIVLPLRAFRFLEHVPPAGAAPTNLAPGAVLPPGTARREAGDASGSSGLEARIAVLQHWVQARARVVIGAASAARARALHALLAEHGLQANLIDPETQAQSRKREASNGGAAASPAPDSAAPDSAAPDSAAPDSAAAVPQAALAPSGQTPSAQAPSTQAQSTQAQAEWFSCWATEQPSSPLAPCILPLAPSAGFTWHAAGEVRLAVLTEAELLPWRTGASPRKNTQRRVITPLEELPVGGFVVHEEYGVGRYEGLQRIRAGDAEGEFLMLRYAEDDKVYVPVERLYQVQPFAGLGEAAPRLSRLGDGGWQKTKARAQRAVREMAGELVAVQATRKLARRPPCVPSAESLNTFAAGFPHTETEDQQQAIEQVFESLAREYPMDHLVCGDAGYGKTEVAVRVACAMVLEGRQTMVLAPTTVLAQQHEHTFRKRLEPLGGRVEALSRFRSPREQRVIAAEFSAGKIDVLVGTHRLLASDVIPPSLGLLVVDEEQRFGVAHKEKIKQLKPCLDVLTLSATPIPRTLHMALSGVREMSVIHTPPADRVSVRTRVANFGEALIREGVERELRRGGQVFFVHNRVETIARVAAQLQSWLPRARIAIAHGQMPERQLEPVMLRFLRGETQILVATSLIENGLDIPRANTIFIDHADHFGLSQLYQLRGRVGRSGVQSYAWLLLHAGKTLREIAHKRLELLQELNDLGAGFRVSMLDLQLRGAGNLLGAEQSGHIHAVGLAMYLRMVEETVESMQRQGETETPLPTPRLELGFPFLLPEHYIPGLRERLETYRRMAEARSEEDLWRLRAELEDRNGIPPAEMDEIWTLLRVRLRCSHYGLSILERRGGMLQAHFARPEWVNTERLLALLGEGHVGLALVPSGALNLGPMPKTPADVLKRLETLDDFVQAQAA